MQNKGIKNHRKFMLIHDLPIECHEKLSSTPSPGDEIMFM